MKKIILSFFACSLISTVVYADYNACMDNVKKAYEQCVVRVQRQIANCSGTESLITCSIRYSGNLLYCSMTKQSQESDCMTDGY